MRNDLIRVHELLMQISVKGADVPPMAEALITLARVVNSMPEEESEEPNE